MHLIPLNPAERILEPYWDMDKAPDDSRRPILESYDVTWSDEACGEIPPAPGLKVRIKESIAHHVAVRLQRNCDLDVSGYDQLRLFGRLSKELCVTIRASVDGQSHVLIDQEPGTGGLNEYEGDLPGEQLESLSIELMPTTTASTMAEFRMISVAATKLEQELDRRSPVYDPSWPEFLADSPDESAPQIALFFDETDLPELRQRWQSPPLDRWYAAVREKAEECLQLEPEAFIGRRAPNADRGKTRPRDRKDGWLSAPVEQAALVGLIEGRPELSRHAARMALAIAHCDRWFTFVPGTTSHERAFYVSYVLRFLPLVLDWAGHMFTPHGREVIRDSMVLKGLPLIESDFRRWEYIRAMNQGLMFNVGRTLAYLSLVPTYPRYEHDLELAEKEELEMIKQYVGPDGGTREGVGYWHVVVDASYVLMALARHHDADVAEWLPDRMLRSGDFALSMRTTCGTGVEFMGINDCNNASIRPKDAAFFSRFGDDPRWDAIYQQILEEGEPRGSVPHLLFAPAISSDESLEDTSSALAAFTATGQADSVRDGRDVDQVHLHLCSGSGKGGHTHQDKGSFILEAAGEPLAIDPGQLSYQATDYRSIKVAGAHNVACPEDDEGEALEQDRSRKEGGRITSATEDNGAVFLVSDNTGAWPKGMFEKNVRRIASPTPQLYIIDDALLMKRSRPVSFRLHSTCPIQDEDEDICRVQGERACLLVRPLNWSPDHAEVSEFGVDSERNPVNMLRLVSRQAKQHRLLTLVEVAPAAGSPQWDTSTQEDMIRICRGTICCEVQVSSGAITVDMDEEDRIVWDASSVS